MNIPKPMYVYIAREKCGCCTAIVSDITGLEKETGKWVAKVIESGRNINRVSWQEYANIISTEETFMSCPHRITQATQVELFNNDNDNEGLTRIIAGIPVTLKLGCMYKAIRPMLRKYPEGRFDKFPVTIIDKNGLVVCEFGKDFTRKEAIEAMRQLYLGQEVNEDQEINDWFEWKE